MTEQRDIREILRQKEPAQARHQGWEIAPGFDLDAFLALPLIARVATTGPTVRPVWFLWEQESFWWLTGEWSRLETILARDPRVALVVDTCDLATGQVRQVTAAGTATLTPFDAKRASRKLARYLGADESAWDLERFSIETLSKDGARLVRLSPERLRAQDLSYVRRVSD